MFGNLKNKLGEVADLKKFSTPKILNSVSSSKQQSVSQSPGSDTPVRLKHSRQSSNASQNGLLNLPTSAATQNIKEKELLNEISKLKVAMEQQASTFQDTLAMKEQGWLTRIQEEEKKAQSIEKQFINLKENEKFLQKQLRERGNTSNNSVETEKQLEILQENYDQLDGLGTQEVAKVKHLLLDTTNQLEETKKQLDNKIARLDSLTEELESANATIEKYKFIAEEKMELDTAMAGLRQKLNAANLKFVTSEKENEDILQQLEEKINVLENRNKQDSLEEDDRIAALIEERTSLDHLLEEKRQELTSIKSSWSEKICNLENKILNLNEKMAEDMLDFKNSEDRVEDLTKENEELKAENKSIKEADIYKATILHLQDQIQKTKDQYSETIAAKEAEIREARKNLHMKEEELNQLKESYHSKEGRLTELEDLYNESFNNLEEAKIGLATLQEEYNVLKSAHDSIASYHSVEKDSRSKVESELITVRTKYETVLGERQKLSENLDHLSDQVVSLESNLAAALEKNTLLDEKCAELERSRDEFRIQHEKTMSLMEDSKENFDEMISQSELVKSLEFTCSSLEDEIQDMKQKFKVQKQRTEDMKKTLQKEFKISSNNINSKSEGNNPIHRERIPSLNESGRDFAVLPTRTESFPNYSAFSGSELESINIPYLKHVLLKFITSRQSEAIQLVRAIAALLRMTPDEEKLLSETMKWKMSWFGSKPNLGKGQKSKVIPPHQ